MKYIVSFIVILLSSNMCFSQNNDSSSYTVEQIEEPDDTIKKKKKKILDELFITSMKHKNIPSAGKANIKPLDLPQSTVVIGKETIEQQQIIRLSEVLKNANGVYVSGNSNASGNNQEEIGARGFTFNGGNTFKNGVRFNNSIIPETNSLENIEILKGSAALLYGNVAPGGILNLITKKPKYTQGGEVNFRAGQFNTYKPTIDIYGSVNNSEKVAYRLISSVEKGNSYRDVVNNERFYVNPSLLFDFTDDTSLLIEGDHLRDSRTPDFGLTTIDYTIIDQPRNTFLGFDWGKFAAKQSSITSTLSHNFKNKWQLKGIYSFQSYDTDLLSSLRPNSTNLVQANGDWTRGVQKNVRTEKYSLAEIDLTGNIETATINHNLLIGIDGDITNSDNLNYKNINSYDKINIYNPTKIISKDPLYASTIVPLLDKNTNAETTLKRAGVYLQDLLSLCDQVKVLAGLRFSHIDNFTNTITFANATTPQKNIETRTIDNVISSKLGIVYQPTKNNSIFVSYSDSFVPNTGTNRFLEALPVSTIDQYELGFKNELFKNNLSINLTGYIINYGNLAQTDFTNGNLNTNIKELMGSQKSQGFELDITGNYQGFKLITGFSFNETRYTKSNIYDTGTILRFTPKNTVNASLFYSFKEISLVKGLELGFTAAYLGERFGGRLRPNNAKTDAEKARKPIKTDGFTQIDASISYAIKSFTIRAKLSNIANELNYYVYDDNTVTPIAPRMLSTTLSYKF